MKKCRHFLLGCASFLLATDHKPLLGLIGDKALEDIENPRLQNLKEKTLRYAFDMVHVPGVLNKGADATSRMPVGGAKGFLAAIRMDPSTQDEEQSYRIETKVTGVGMSSLYGIYHRDTPCSINSITLRAITWKRVEEAAATVWCTRGQVILAREPEGILPSKSRLISPGSSHLLQREDSGASLPQVGGAGRAPLQQRWGQQHGGQVP